MIGARHKIYVTGMGAMSAIGNDTREILESLLAGKSGVEEIRYLKTGHREFPCGEVKLSEAEMLERLGLPQEGAYTRTSLMGMIALGEALEAASLNGDDLRKCGFISGTTVGGMDKSELYYEDFVSNGSHNEFISTHDCGVCSEMIAGHFGKFGFMTTLSTACSSAANAIILGANLIASGKCDIVIAGGSECITKYHLNGFNTLRILDTERCRPFDADRAGINLGEGAGYLVMESEESAARRSVKPLCMLSGWGNACDAYHQTATSDNGEGAYQAMSKALKVAGIAPEDIDYVNAHGTGTPNNDKTETAALKRIFGDKMPLVSSTKSYTGHTTSASGSIEPVICILAMQEHFTPVNLGFKKRIEDGFDPVTNNNCGVKLHHVMCNSFGFGGNDSSLILSSLT